MQEPVPPCFTPPNVRQKDYAKRYQKFHCRRGGRSLRGQKPSSHFVPPSQLAAEISSHHTLYLNIAVIRQPVERRDHEPENGLISYRSRQSKNAGQPSSSFIFAIPRRAKSRRALDHELQKGAIAQPFVRHFTPSARRFFYADLHCTAKRSRHYHYFARARASRHRFAEEPDFAALEIFPTLRLLLLFYRPGIFRQSRRPANRDMP